MKYQISIFLLIVFTSWKCVNENVVTQKKDSIFSAAPVLNFNGLNVITEKDSSKTITWGEIVNGLQLGISGDTNTLAMHVKNSGTKPVTVFRRVMAGNYHYDWYHLCLISENGKDTIHLMMEEDRDRSVPVSLMLKPGQEFVEYVNLAWWCNRPINLSRQKTENGKYKLSLVYTLDAKQDNWCGVDWFGTLEVGPVDFFIEK